MTKITKKTRKADIKKLAQKTDWKFVITLIVLGIIGFGVFSIFRGLASQDPESYWINFNYNPGLNQYQTKNGGKNRNGGNDTAGQMGSVKFNQMINSRAEDRRDKVGCPEGQTRVDDGSDYGYLCK